MPKPVIFAIDDDPSVLNSVERDLRAHYGQDYRILPINSGKAALDYLKKLEQRNETVALFLVDQRMPEMSGTEFLTEALQTYPQAKRVLLTAYADTQAAINSINEVGLDYYLMKPWHPPEEKLYPVLDELLADWKAHVRLPYEGIRVAGTLWSLASHQVKDFLTRHQIPYQWLDIEKDSNVRKLVEGATSETKLPVIFFPDGKILIEPDLKELADKVGLQTRAELPFYDIVIIGSGPAGLAAAVYAGSEGYKCLVIERAAPGGQAGSSPKIENYLGFPTGISGDDLTRRAVSQAKRFGVEILSAQEGKPNRNQGTVSHRQVAGWDRDILSRRVDRDGRIAFHTLTMPGADALTGAGIYYGAAYTEAMNYVEKDVFVVGGANSAAQGALYLSRFARKVTVLIRGPEATASKYLVDALNANAKIEMLVNTDLVEVKGSNTLEQIVIENTKRDEVRTCDAAAMFVFIGVQPQSKIVSGLVMCSGKGYIFTGPDLMVDKKPPFDKASPLRTAPQNWTLERDPFLLETSTPGIFAAGDVRYGTNHRVASAVGEGAIAFALMKEYLKTL